MSTIGILGTSRMGVRLALLFAEIRHQVILGSRDRERTDRIVGKLGRTNIQPGNYQQAADNVVGYSLMYLLKLLPPKSALNVAIKRKKSYSNVCIIAIIVT
ncbi:NAD(P)-binding domain-containing protein [Fischerella thermalis]|jgi:Rps23 Pro-64 3,4-dihydroxylase Tpa1-like proline 4-hydroxylase|uniref:Pyrroline-5-carboxylate reductase catalytic N-terminal domain-containing protein n=1 Tax=Fischerella thermalis JSC-11 TaxID=741277 RepID=G6FR26_9CYAN|nr:NAD(P)-binding domain-containing protein [Fischerella thermalis]EHC15900.1 hypothetical protein FJSC11DRAFT_1323 [Fischerella thermalis JSC-11]